MSPMREHYQKELAIQAAEQNNIANVSEYQKLLKRLYDDKAMLKNISSIQDKATAKAEMLPSYAAWVQGVMMGEHPVKGDKITATILIWMLDCGQLDAALPLAQFAINNDLISSDDYQRPIRTIIPEEYAARMMGGYTVNKETVETLIEWATAKNDDGLHTYNMPDQVRAKVLKAAGEWAEEKSKDWARTLYEKALSYNDRIGVKKKIAALS